MSDPHARDPKPTANRQDDPQHDNPAAYTIRRKGSRYNISGPHGRVFSTYKSASVTGPRWEELTRTPWPYRSSAYESGTRLWQIGVIERDQIGQRKLKTRSKPTRATKPKPGRSAAKTPARAKKANTRAAKPAKAVPQADPRTHQPERARPVLARPAQPLGVMPVLALPAPRINLAEQTRLIQALRGDPRLLFQPKVREALQHEVEYHRPHALWASTLLRLLVRFEKRERLHTRLANNRSSDVIQNKHIAWQEQRMARAAVSQ